MSKAGEKVISRDGRTEGVTTGASHLCGLEGCGGLRLAVRWPRVNGRPRTTYPCTKGMDYEAGVWKIV